MLCTGAARRSAQKAARGMSAASSSRHLEAVGFPTTVPYFIRNTLNMLLMFMITTISQFIKRISTWVA